MKASDRPLFRRGYNQGGSARFDLTPTTEQKLEHLGIAKPQGLEALLQQAEGYGGGDTGPRMPSGAALRAAGAYLLAGGAQKLYRSPSSVASDLGGALAAANAAQARESAIEAKQIESRKTRRAANVRAIWESQSRLKAAQEKSREARKVRQDQSINNEFGNIIKSKSTNAIKEMRVYRKSKKWKTDNFAEKLANLQRFTAEGAENYAYEQKRDDEVKALKETFDKINELGIERVIEKLNADLKVPDPKGKILEAGDWRSRDFSSTMRLLDNAFQEATVEKAEIENNKQGQRMNAFYAEFPANSIDKFGKPGRITAANATPEQVVTVNKKVSDERIAVAAATGAALGRRKTLVQYRLQHLRVHDTATKLSRIMRNIKASPASTGTVGSVAKFLTGLMSQLTSAYNLTTNQLEPWVDVLDVVKSYVGDKGPETDNFNKKTARFDEILIKKFGDRIIKAGTQNAMLRSQILSTAIALASIDASRTPGSRLTNLLIENKIQTMGGTRSMVTGNIPKAIIANMQTIGDDMVSRLQVNRYTLDMTPLELRSLPAVPWKFGNKALDWTLKPTFRDKIKLTPVPNILVPTHVGSHSVREGN